MIRCRLQSCRHRSHCHSHPVTQRKCQRQGVSRQCKCTSARRLPVQAFVHENMSVTAWHAVRPGAVACLCCGVGGRGPREVQLPRRIVPAIALHEWRWEARHARLQAPQTDVRAAGHFEGLLVGVHRICTTAEVSNQELLQLPWPAISHTKCGPPALLHTLHGHAARGEPWQHLLDDVRQLSAAQRLLLDEGRHQRLERAVVLGQAPVRLRLRRVQQLRRRRARYVQVTGTP
jgi:hypothetical protein